MSSRVAEVPLLTFMALVSHACNTSNQLEQGHRNLSRLDRFPFSLPSLSTRRENHCRPPLTAVLMIGLKRRASQELLPTRAPKLARAQDPSVLSQVGEGFCTVAKFILTNVNAFYEGTRFVRSTLTCMMRFRLSCRRGRDTQAIPPAQAISLTPAHTSQISASSHPKGVQNRTKTFRWTIAPVLLHTFTYSQA